MSNTPKPLRWTLFLPKASNRGIKCWRVDTYGSTRLVISKVNPFHLKSIHKGFVLRSPRFCVFVLKTTTLETWKQHGWLLRRSCLFILSFTVLHFAGKNFFKLVWFISVAKKYVCWDKEEFVGGKRNRLDGDDTFLRETESLCYLRNIFLVSCKSTSGMTGRHQLWRVVRFESNRVDLTTSSTPFISYLRNIF